MFAMTLVRVIMNILNFIKYTKTDKCYVEDYQAQKIKIMQ